MGGHGYFEPPARSLASSDLPGVAHLASDSPAAWRCQVSPAFWTISFRNSPNRTVLVANDGTGFLLFLWPDSIYLSIEIPVRKQLKSYETAVKSLMNGNCCRLGGVARVKNTENPFAEGQHSKKEGQEQV